MAQPYNSQQIAAALVAPPVAGWQLDPATGQIFKQFRFPDFVQSLAFVNRVGAIAEQLGHHPDITINYNRVRLDLITHDAGGLTDLDFKMAAQSNAASLPL